MKTKSQFPRLVPMFLGVLGGGLAVLNAAAATFTDDNWISMGGFPGADLPDLGGVYAAVGDDSGNLYIGGQFSVVGEVIANGIAKWDGTNWTALGSGLGDGGGVNNGVRAMVIWNGNLYVGGDFGTAGGVPANHIAKWDGSSWSSLESGLTSVNFGTFPVSALAVLGGELYVGGDFVSAGGVPARNVAKWNGSTWSSLNSGMTSNDGVLALAASGSDLYVGGVFSTAGGIAANNVAKWDGTNWSALGEGAEGQVTSLAVLGGEVYATGFTMAGGATNIAKWDGHSWSALGAEFPAGYAGVLAVSGTDVYVSFVPYDLDLGGPLYHLASISKWGGSSWSIVTSGQLTGPVEALVASGTNLYVVGEFSVAGGNPANGVAKWDGMSWSALGTARGLWAEWGPNLNALAVSGNDLYVAGYFEAAGGMAANGFAKWDGSRWSVLDWGDTPAALAVSGTNIFAAVYTGVAKWDGGTNWSPLGPGFNSWVSVLAVSGTNLYAGGNFTIATNSGGAPVTVNRIARWDGNNWSAFGGGLNDDVNALAVSGTNVYAGGGFTRATNSGGASVTVNRIARWDGDTWSPVGSGMNNSVGSLAVLGTDLS
ncbi:MAG: hypothetical protein KIS67_05105 [Verrucomicrobiae bacterium]|nr:hypothetical protein [Verrucomicrobiae bacterium]